MVVTVDRIEKDCLFTKESLIEGALERDLFTNYPGNTAGMMSSASFDPYSYRD